MPTVAVAGDVVATASTATALAGVPGAWAPPMQVSETEHHRLRVGGRAALRAATGEFTFTDTNGVTTSLRLSLEAGATLLQEGNSGVLVDGDEASDTHGNRLTVHATGVRARTGS